MTANNESNATVTRIEGHELIMERFFMASRELVYTMYTERDHVVKWWGPIGWTTSISQMDVHPGGVWHYCMRSSDGQEAWGKSVYEEVIKPERLVYTDAFSDENGNDAEGMPVMKITVDFEDEGNGTRIISRTLFASPEELQQVVEMGAIEGMRETFDRLEAYLNAQ